MSLTGHIKLGRGEPVFDWFAENFPNTREMATEVNRELRDGPATKPCAVPVPAGSDASLVGTAVGYVLSASLRDDAITSTVATTGARLLDRFLRNLKPLPSAIERQIVSRVEELAPSRRELVGDEWYELLRLVSVLARFEQVRRAGAHVVMMLMPLFIKHAGDLDGLGHACATPPTLADLDSLTRATLSDQLHLRQARQLHLGPVFAQSIPLGGADADIIADGELIELKSSGQARIVGRAELWQLLGYLLADTDDKYKLRRCSFRAPRRRRSGKWEVQDFIDALAGRPCDSVEHWRAEFARILSELPVRMRMTPIRGPAPIH
jgi:hypothetical protein